MPVKAVRTGLVWVETTSLSDSLRNAIPLNYTYQHPREPEESLCSLVETGGRIGIPGGDMDKLHNLIPNITIEDRTIAPPFNKPVSLTGLTLRDYQEATQNKVLKAIAEGMTSFNLAGSCSSGKSITLASLIVKLKTKTLIIAHLSLLTTQLYEEIRDATDADVRILDKDNLELGDINICTSQFVSRRPELWEKIKKNIGLLVIDEGENLAAETTLKIFQRAWAKYRIAVTATFSRSTDGRTQVLHDMISKRVFTLTNPKLIKPIIISVRCEEQFYAPQSKHLYKRGLIRFFKDNRSIDFKILAITLASIKKDRQVLIACDLGDLQERYASLIEANGIRCGIMSSKTTKKQRNKLLEEYDEGKVKVLLGFGVLVAGLSMPRVETIIRVSTPNSKEKLEQLVGRSRRDYEGKSGAYIIDLVFNGFRNAVATRDTFYKTKVHTEGWKYFRTTWVKFEKEL